MRLLGASVRRCCAGVVVAAGILGAFRAIGGMLRRAKGDGSKTGKGDAR